MLVDSQLRQLLARPAAASSDYDLNPEIRHSTAPLAGPVPALRPAAVLIAVQPHAGGARVILTKRASHLKHHPGQVAFPGGKIEPFDGSAERAALRESQEEIGLDPAQLRLLGRLPDHETVTGFLVTPVLALVEGDFQPRPEPGEVEEVFDVPLQHLLTPARYSIESRIWRGQPRRFYTVPWGPYYIWGATARILRGLAARTE